MKEYTCKDCDYYSDGECHFLCRMTPDNCELCANFRDKDGKRPRFCRLASSVDEMAEALRSIAVAYTECVRAMDGKPVEFTQDEIKRIKGEMKAWLMEVERQ